ncbi:MAG: ribonuclease PH [Actinobacteria bacterium]|nr:ribonuclease PH [Actinomycetota bacterium]
MTTREDGRTPEEIRPVAVTLDYQQWADGSVLLDMGKTRVLVSASYEERVPRWLMGSGKGWVTAEYSMLPRATLERTPREVTKGRPSGRTQEIQRLIGRSLRAVTDLTKMPEVMITIDCDVLQADGGTRTASITAGYIALALALRKLREKGIVKEDPLVDGVAAISCGIVGGARYLDLDYSEDSSAEVDFNVVMTASGKIVEVQGTAEETPFSRDDLDVMLDLAQSGIERLAAIQDEVLAG